MQGWNLAKTYSYRAALWGWPIWSLTALVLFALWSVLVAQVVQDCYRPPGAVANSAGATGAETAPEPKAAQGWWTMLTNSLREDRSGASAVCLAILLLALARFGYLRWCLALHRQLLQEDDSQVRADTILGLDDPVLHFLSTSRSEADLQLLERRLAAIYDLHGFVGPCITLGLFGTLIGLWIGFRNTLGDPAAFAQAGEGLQIALSSSVVVVATAALSSITGIGLGQLVIEPLADRIDGAVEQLVTAHWEAALSRRSA